MCIDALDECAGVQRVKLLDSLNQILENSPGTRIFVTGRPNIQAEIEKCLSGRVLSFSNKVLAQRIQSSDTDLTQVDLYIADIKD